MRLTAMRRAFGWALMSVGTAMTIVIRIQQPDLTETRLLVVIWPYIFVTIIGSVMTVYTMGKTK